MKKVFAIAVLAGVSICAMPLAQAQVPHRDDAAHRDDHRADHRNDHRDDHRNDHRDDHRRP
ncbi:hypothetical protein [Paraburkholderia sp. BCC1885]|uniref:hypothetical protein n=1 Tax=Paraburkholderia sp. BCC1885 TaxID=2562669 RepID=UPI001183F4A3|nr:hypothetical protein [Paraburkholderia sp. BCC1885]